MDAPGTLHSADLMPGTGNVIDLPSFWPSANLEICSSKCFTRFWTCYKQALHYCEASLGRDSVDLAPSILNLKFFGVNDLEHFPLLLNLEKYLVKYLHVPWIYFKHQNTSYKVFSNTLYILQHKLQYKDTIWEMDLAEIHHIEYWSLNSEGNNLHHFLPLISSNISLKAHSHLLHIV